MWQSSAQNKNLESECDLLRFLNVLHAKKIKNIYVEVQTT